MTTLVNLLKTLRSPYQDSPVSTHPDSRRKHHTITTAIDINQITNTVDSMRIFSQLYN